MEMTRTFLGGILNGQIKTEDNNGATAWVPIDELVISVKDDVAYIELKQNGVCFQAIDVDVDLSLGYKLTMTINEGFMMRQQVTLT